MSEKSNPETPRASDGHSGYSSTNESVLQSPNSVAIRKKKKPSLKLSKSSTGRPVLVHSPCSMNRLNEPSSVHSQSRDDLTTIETCSDPNTPHSSTASRSHSGGDFSAFQARMQQEKPRLEHWPLPSWPADDPMRLKLRALIIAKDYALGSGDQGTVFYATHKTTGKAYAVKELISHANSSRENLRSTFRRELVTLYRNVDTQHVVRVFDVYLSGDRMRLLMELMELGSLVDVLEAMRMKKVRPKSPGGCCSAEDFGYCKCPIQLQHAEPYGRLCITDLQYVAYGILHALHSIHSKNIIHRDLKPSNVLVGSTGIVKLCDFGVSRLLGDGVVATTTTGSQLYFAPERVTNVNGYGYKADVWSAGVLLAYCACGRYPIEGKLFDVLTQITSRDFKLQFPDEMPLCPLFVDFVSKCSTSNPEERPTAFEMLHHEFLFKNYEASAESSPLTQSSTRESFDPETNSSSRVCPASLIKPKFVEFIGENEKLEQLRVLTRGELRNVP